MRILGLVFVSPLWGALSAQFFFQAWTSLIIMFIGVLGFVRGRVARSNNALGVLMALAQVVLFSLLLRGGEYLVVQLLGFGWSRAENVVYWVFAIPTSLFFLLQLPEKLRGAWRRAMVPWALEDDILRRRIAAEDGMPTANRTAK